MSRAVDAKIAALRARLPAMRAAALREIEPQPTPAFEGPWMVFDQAFCDRVDKMGWTMGIEREEGETYIRYADRLIRARGEASPLSALFIEGNAS